MRIIKFRAWDTEYERWVTDKMGMFLSGDLLKYDRKAGDENDVVFRESGVYNSGFDNIVLQQFTGLLDKNGKEIYEGDIVRTLEDGDVEVIFKDGMFGCEVSRPQSDEGGTEYYDEFINLWALIDCGYWGSDTAGDNLEFTVEVIGNIYENPELLPKNGWGE